MNQNVHPFPFSELPQLTASEISLKKRLLGIYHFVGGQGHALQVVADAFKEILRTDATVKITHFETRNLDQVLKELPSDVLMGVMRVEPQSKKAAVIFDHLLAKLMIKILLAGHKPLTTEQLTQLQLTPLTPLEEAVVQYILVFLIEKVGTQLAEKNFSLVYEDVLRNPDQCRGVFSNQDQFVLFGIKMSLFERDFYVKLVLPLGVADDICRTDQQQSLQQQRLLLFGGFQTEMLLSIGKVELNQQDLQALVPGDIVLFDHVSVKKDGDQLTGTAELVTNEQEGAVGYLVALQAGTQGIQATIKAAL